MATDVKRKEAPKKSIAKRVTDIVILTLFVIIIVLFTYVLITHLCGKIPKFFGYSMLHIISPSMEPTIMTGTYILIESAKPEEIKVGDVITFYSEDKSIYNMPNTHRVVEIEEKDNDYFYTTKGDNEKTNPVNDIKPATGERLIGRYVKNLPLVTAVAGFLGTKAVYILLILLPTILVISYQIKEIVKKAQRLKSEELIKKEFERIRSEGGLKPEDIEAFLASRKAESEAEKEKDYTDDKSDR